MQTLKSKLYLLSFMIGIAGCSASHDSSHSTYLFDCGQFPAGFSVDQTVLYRPDLPDTDLIALRQSDSLKAYVVDPLGQRRELIWSGKHCVAVERETKGTLYFQEATQNRFAS